LARLFILGAGFSRYAGLPLGRELFARVVAKPHSTMLYDNVLRRDIDRFRLFKERTEGVELEEEDVDAEELMSFLDVEHFLRACSRKHVCTGRASGIGQEVELQRF